MRGGARAVRVAAAAALSGSIGIAGWGFVLLSLGGCGGSESPVAGDRTPPAVVSLTPADGAVAVPAGVVAAVAFSEPVVIDWENGPPLRLEGAAGTVTAVVRLDSTATTLTLTPVTPLPAGDDYRLVLAAGIADQSGNARPDSLASRFTTALAFRDIGRLFAAGERSDDLTVLDIGTYEPVAGSPVPIGGAALRLHGEPGEGAVYVLYDADAASGIAVVDARSLAVLRDTGPTLPAGLSDLTVAGAHAMLLAVDPAGAAMLVLDSGTLAPLRAPLRFDRPDSEPVRLAISARFDLLLVGLNGGGRLAAYRLPGLDPVAGFPVSATGDITDIRVDEERGMAWVAGSERYAVVDLLNPARTEVFEIPVSRCSFCHAQLWRILLAPDQDRAILLFRRQSLAAVELSTLHIAEDSPYDLELGNVFFTDMVRDPRQGDLVILGWRNAQTPFFLVDSATMTVIERQLPFLGDKAVDLELLP